MSLTDKQLKANSLPNTKILAFSKLKACADDKLNGATIMISVSDQIENIVGKRENAVYHNAFLTMFSKNLFLSR